MRSVGFSRGKRWSLLPVVLLLLVSMLFPVLGSAQGERTLAPIGGGYTTTSLQEFSRLVIEHADGEFVQILVITSAYGDALEDREENIELAENRTQQIENACNTVLTSYPDFSHCDAIMLHLFDRSEAMDPENSALFTDEETDGAYMLGGDQTLAMQILANSPAEAVMDAAYQDGVVFGGTSAGAAVESRDMIAGYPDPGYPYNALERDMVLIWWFNDGDDERGLIFGAETIIFDQHFYERGRFGRLLNIVAQSDEQYGGASRLGVGVDYGTGVAVTNETILSRVFGDSSIAIIDGESRNATFSWNGPNETLSARNIVTHIMGQHPASDLTYDADRRTPVIYGQDLPAQNPGNWQRNLLRTAGRATLVLGGDLSLDFDGPAMQDFTTRVQAQRRGNVLVVGTGTASTADNQTLANEYATEIDALLPSQYTVKPIAYGGPDWNLRLLVDLAKSAGVVFVGGDQSQMAAPLGDAWFRAFVQAAVLVSPLVMTDGAMTAVMGDWYVTDPDPGDDYQDEGIEDFQIDGVTIAKGLGIVRGASFEPTVTYDQRWGRLYNLAAANPKTIVFGISEITTLVLSGKDAKVAGERSVIALDGRAGYFGPSDNGSLTALNVLMDLYAPGDTVASNR